MIEVFKSQHTPDILQGCRSEIASQSTESMKEAVRFDFEPICLLELERKYSLRKTKWFC
jgi:hypothetical protein